MTKLKKLRQEHNLTQREVAERWGDEEIGYVKTWHVGPDGAVIHGPDIRREEAWRRGYQFECPFA